MMEKELHLQYVMFFHYLKWHLWPLWNQVYLILMVSWLKWLTLTWHEGDFFLQHRKDVRCPDAFSPGGSCSTVGGRGREKWVSFNHNSQYQPNIPVRRNIYTHIQKSCILRILTSLNMMIYYILLSNKILNTWRLK